MINPIYFKNDGRIYSCGAVAPSSNKSLTTPLIEHLCSTKNKSRQFAEAAWKRRIRRGQISVEEDRYRYRPRIGASASATPSAEPSLITPSPIAIVIVDPDIGLSPGSRVFYHRSPWMEPICTIVHDDDDDNHHDNHDNDDDPHQLRILYRDDHIMAVHKPSGLPTMPSQTYFEYSVLNVLRRKRNRKRDDHDHDMKFNIGNDNSNDNNNGARADDNYNYMAPPQPIHRLGVGTSGVLIIATSLEARAQLTKSIRDKQVKKVYRALVMGADVPESATIDCPIGQVPFPIGGGTIHAACPAPLIPSSSLELTQAQAQALDNIDLKSNTSKDTGTGTCTRNSTSMAKGIKNALSYVSVVKRNVEANTAIVEVEIPTGRPHQIRIHMAFIGHPLVGDPLYLSGGIPDRRPRVFPSRTKEDEDMDTDDDDDGDDDESSDTCIAMGCGTGMEGAEKKDTVMRVPLPRDCGYKLHAYQMTVEHPTKRGERMTFTATPPKDLI